MKTAQKSRYNELQSNKTEMLPTTLFLIGGVGAVRDEITLRVWLLQTRSISAHIGHICTLHTWTHTQFSQIQNEGTTFCKRLWHTLKCCVNVHV